MTARRLRRFCGTRVLMLLTTPSRVWETHTCPVVRDTCQVRRDTYQVRRTRSARSAVPREPTDTASCSASNTKPTTRCPCCPNTAGRTFFLSATRAGSCVSARRAPRSPISPGRKRCGSNSTSRCLAVRRPSRRRERRSRRPDLARRRRRWSRRPRRRDGRQRARHFTRRTRGYPGAVWFRVLGATTTTTTTRRRTTSRGSSLRTTTTISLSPLARIHALGRRMTRAPRVSLCLRRPRFLVPTRNTRE